MKRKEEVCVIPAVVKSVGFRTSRSAEPDSKGRYTMLHSVTINGDPWHLTWRQYATLMGVIMPTAAAHGPDLSKTITPALAKAMVAALVSAMRGMRITRDPVVTDDDITAKFTIKYS